MFGLQYKTARMWVLMAAATLVSCGDDEDGSSSDAGSSASGTGSTTSSTSTGSGSQGTAGDASGSGGQTSGFMCPAGCEEIEICEGGQCQPECICETSGGASMCGDQICADDEICVIGCEGGATGDGGGGTEPLEACHPRTQLTCGLNSGACGQAEGDECSIENAMCPTNGCLLAETLTCHCA